MDESSDRQAADMKPLHRFRFTLHSLLSMVLLTGIGFAGAHNWSDEDSVCLSVAWLTGVAIGPFLGRSFISGNSKSDTIVLLLIAGTGGLMAQCVTMFWITARIAAAI